MTSSRGLATALVGAGELENPTRCPVEEARFTRRGGTRPAATDTVLAQLANMVNRHLCGSAADENGRNADEPNDVHSRSRRQVWTKVTGVGDIRRPNGATRDAIHVV
ncbi:MAG: hypothetical protein AB7N53_03360 [Candidatus Binatia bacterium]